MKIKEKVPPKR